MKAKAFAAAILLAGAMACAVFLSSGPKPEAYGPHCVALEGSSAPARCFATFTASIAHATDGRVTDAPEDPAEAMRDEEFMRELSPAPCAITEGAAHEEGGDTGPAEADEEVRVLGLIFEHADYGGRSVGLLAASGCQKGRSHRYPNLGRTWNDRASSLFVDTREECGGARIHQHAEFRGRSFYVARKARALGGLDGRASPVTIEPLI